MHDGSSLCYSPPVPILNSRIMPTKTDTTVDHDAETSESEVIRYELMVIVTPDVTQADYEKHVEEIKKLLGAHNSKIGHTEDWGKRDLAYSIKKKEHGYYYVFDFEMDPSEVPELNKQLRITPFVLRYLIVKLPENYTPQKYDLETPVRPEYKPEAMATEGAKRQNYSRPGSGATHKPRPVAHTKPMPLPAKETVPKVEPPPAKPKEDLSKLDEKLEELLSGGDDLNL